jgi:hypothetical protein
LVEEQFGFRKGLSTNNATFRLTHEVLQALNNLNDILRTFCDLAKAFDRVNHSILMSKLAHYG